MINFIPRLRLTMEQLAMKKIISSPEWRGGLSVAFIVVARIFTKEAQIELLLPPNKGANGKSDRKTR